MIACAGCATPMTISAPMPAVITAWSSVKRPRRNAGNSARIAPARPVQMIAMRVAAHPERIARCGSCMPRDCPTSAAEAAEKPTHGRNDNDSS